MNELEPCPFCGSDHLTLKRNWQLDGMTFIVCEPCGAVTSFHERSGREQTVDAWNTRAQVTSL